MNKFTQYITLVIIVWFLSGLAMHWYISNRIEEEGSYVLWFGERIIVKQDVFINNKQKEK